MQLKKLILDALTEAIKPNYHVSNKKELHRKRSAKFVEQLTIQFKKYYESQLSVCVLSRESSEHRMKFDVNELLYDVLVCDTTSEARSPVRHKKLTIITNAIWQIESEFRKDGKQAILDFNKLVIGNASNKLFIGPIVNNIQAFINTLLAPAQHCSGNIYLALVSHPDDWNKKTPEIFLWQLSDKNWSPIAAG
jgi:hypothetical protein